MSIIPGTPAPDRAWQVLWRDGARDVSGRRIHLSDYLGKVVVVNFVEVPEGG